ncbi:hypothetical protein C1896_18565 [Pseudomonadaceae bacterium SI-3]|nr:hypothetical protein C1896_18565 [Pseudomonadaceae bacterium SI-3]
MRYSANESRVAGDVATNARSGWPLLDSDQRWEAHLGVVNLFGRDYYDNLRINGGFGRITNPRRGGRFNAGSKLTFK